MNFHHTKTKEAVTITATTAAGKPQPPSEWMMHASGAALMAVATLKTLADSNEATMDAECCMLGHSHLVELPEHEAKALGLPPRAPFALQVQHQGLPSEPHFSIQWQLRQRTGAGVVISERLGSLIRAGNQWSRLSATHFHLIEACDRISGAMATQDMDERLRAYASLTTYLPETTGEGVATSPLLRQFQVFDAGAFTLRPRIENGRLLFDPVLYARKKAQPGDDPLDEENEPEPLLPEAANKDFVEILSEDAGRYALGGNRYVVLSPHLVRAMSTVKRLRDSQDTAAQQRLFLEPCAVLREEFARDLGDEGLDEILGSLFLETKTYLAGRVIGIGIWKKPVLPWIKQRGSEWFPLEDENEPPTAGLRVETINGPVDLPLRKAEAKELLQKIQKARELGDVFVEHQGHRLPVSEATEEALRSVMDPPKNPTGDSEAKMALLIEGNYETVGFTAKLAPREPKGTACLPSGLLTNLKTHQIDGLQWLQESWQQGMPGVLLADDMGLGKTLQALAFLVWLKENGPANSDQNAGGVLIVAPTSLLRNWKAEHDMHFSQPGLGELKQVHGSCIAKMRQGDGKGLDAERLRRADWVLTTYETLNRFQDAFAKVRFRCVVLDEAQKVKTPGTQVRDATLALNADFKIAMTGTPVENRRSDLWCISDAVYPSLLGSLKEFSEIYEKDECANSVRNLKDFITIGRCGEETPCGFKASPRPFMMRRMKENVLDGLPEKTSQPRPIDMPSAQAVRFREIVASALGSTQSGAKLEAIQALRMASLHPWLTKRSLAGDVTDFPYDNFIADSARIKSLVDILNEIRYKEGGEKALIFVNSRQMQTWLRGLFKKMYNMSDVDLINGATPEKQRQDAVDRFQKSAPGFGLILLSPKAAGVGFTLTAANHVIHLDRWWNPAVEDQCTDRAYRIGQKKDVTIWIPQAIHPDPDLRDHSFDLQLHELLENKRKMSRDLLAPVENKEKDTEQLFKAVVG